MFMEVNTKVKFFGLNGNRMSLDVNDELESDYDDLESLENSLYVALNKILNEWEDAYEGIYVASKQYIRVYDDNGKMVKSLYHKEPVTFSLEPGDDWLVDSMNQICGW